MCASQLVHFMRYSDDDLVSLVTRAAERAKQAVATLDTDTQSLGAVWSGESGKLPEPLGGGDSLPAAVARALEEPTTHAGGKKRPKKR